MEANRNKYGLYFPVMLFFAVLFMLVSIWNHYHFRSYALDLGLYNNALFDYSHCRLNYSPLLEPNFHLRNQFADHFDLFLVLVSPLFYVFGSYTLLWIQIFAVLLGGLGTAKVLETISSNKWIPFLGMIHFYCVWGIYSALAFDYHSNVIAAMFVPWFYYFLQQNKRTQALLFFFLILICKENMALWAIFITSGFAWIYKTDKLKRNFCLTLSGLAGLYFVLAIKVFIPAFSIQNQDYIHFDFKVLGENYGEALKTVITKPLYTFRLLFESPLTDSDSFGIKSELHLFILFSGGFALLLRPAYLWMLIPIYGQKLFNGSYMKWGLNYHYSIEFVPIITLALFSFLDSLNKEKLKIQLAVGMVLLTCGLTISGMQGRQSKWYNEAPENLFSAKHYQRVFDINEVHKIINRIKPDNSVCASNTIIPHLANRKEIYQFPYINGAQILLLLDEPESYYPLSEPDFKQQLTHLMQDSIYNCSYHNGPFYVFVKKDISFSVAD